MNSVAWHRCMKLFGQINRISFMHTCMPRMERTRVDRPALLSHAREDSSVERHGILRGWTSEATDGGDAARGK